MTYVTLKLNEMARACLITRWEASEDFGEPIARDTVHVWHDADGQLQAQLRGELPEPVGARAIQRLFARVWDAAANGEAVLVTRKGA